MKHFIRNSLLFGIGLIGWQIGNSQQLKTGSFQVASEKISNLSIGDKVPDIEFDNVLNYKASKIKLSDFKGKLIILDFWATWCTACIKNFGKIDSLQKKLGDKIQVILVDSKGTNDKLDKVEYFLQNWKEKHKTFLLPTAVLDTLAEQYFTHTFIPHYIWIGADGELKAITSSEELSEENILGVANKQSIWLSEKKDFNPEIMFPLGKDFQLNNLLNFSVFIKGKLPIESLNQARIIDGIVRGRVMRNIPLLEMYRFSINAINSSIGYNAKRTILELKDSTKLIYKKSTDLESWEKDNLYTYDLVTPVSEAKDLFHRILNDLNNYSGYYGRIEKRKVKYLSLVLLGPPDKLKTKGNKPENRFFTSEAVKYISNLPMVTLTNDIERIRNIDTPVIDDTDYKGKIDINISVALDDLSALKTELRKYNLDLIEKEKELEMFILTEK